MSSSFFYRYQRDSKMDWNQMCKKQYKMFMSDLIREQERAAFNDAEKELSNEEYPTTKDEYYQNCNNLLDKQWVQEEKWNMLPELVKGIHDNIHLNSTWCWPLHYIPAKDIKKIWVQRERQFVSYIVIEKIDHECIVLDGHIHGFLLQPTEYVQRLEEHLVVITNERSMCMGVYWPHKDDGTPLTKAERSRTDRQTCAYQTYYTG